jgi:hypothetical protein
MRGHENIRHDDKTTSQATPKGDDCRFDLYFVMNGRNDLLDLELPGRRLE